MATAGKKNYALLARIMNDKPLVSVLTPCFNSGQYLERCIQSVLAQDYLPIEHLIQDGGSQDDTLGLLAQYGDKINWVSQPDAGQSDALNKALHRCRGEILLVLNADDELLPHAVSWAVAQLDAYPEEAAIYGDQYYVDPEGRIAHEAPLRPAYEFARVFCVEDVPPAQAMFIRRSCLETVGWYVDVSRRTCPDYEMLVRLGLRFPLRYIPEFVTRYRVHPESQGCQSQWTEEMVRSKREVMDRVFQSPETPPSLQKLRHRAYAGLLWWSANVYLGQGDVVRGFARYVLSLAQGGRLWRHAPSFLRICLLVSLRKVRRHLQRPQERRHKEAAEC